MLSFPRTPKEWLFAIAGGLALVAIPKLAISMHDVSNYKTTSLERAVSVEGILESASKRLVLRSKNGVELDCLVSYCGFPGAYTYSGKNITLWLSEGRVVQIKVDSTTKDVRPLVATEMEENVARYKILFCLALMLFAFGFVIKSKPHQT